MKNNSRVSDIRVVKCPKCTKLLPEPADVPFYICGGCSTTLQAKYYKKADERRNTVSEGSGSLKINEDDSVIEPGHLKVEKPSKLVQGDHGSVGKHEDGKGSSSNEPKEQQTQLTPGNAQVRQDEIVVEEELLSANSSGEDASPETTTTKTEEKALSNLEAGELNQNDVNSCRLEQDEVASSPSEVLLSSETSRRKTTVPVQMAELEPKPGVSSFKSEPNRPDEPTTGVKKLTLQLGSPDGEVATKDQNIPANHSKGQAGFKVKHENEVSPRDEHVYRNGSSSQFLRSNRKGEGADGFGCNGEQFGGVSSNIVTSSNDSMLIQDRELRHLTTKNKERDEATRRNNFSECEDNKILGSLPSEINSSFRINSKKMDESELMIPEAEQKAGLDLSYKAEVSTASGQDGKRESEQSFEVDARADGNIRVPASSSSKTVSKTAVKAIPEEKMAELRKIVDGFESKASSKVKETAAVSATLQVGSSYGDIPKSPTRNSFACDGSVSSCDGNDDKVVDPTVAEDKRHQNSSVTNKTCSASALQRQTDDLQTVSGSDSFHSAAQSIPAMLDEFKMSEGFRHGSYRRARMRPRTGRVLSSAPLYRRSPDTSYESSTRASLVHEEIYDHPIHYQPYSSRDTGSRITRRHPHRSDVDGRMFADTTWMREELPICPYHASTGRHQICCQGARRAAYRPLTHSMAQIPYSGETVRSAYQVNDPHYHPRPVFESWSSHLPYPGGYHNRSRHVPREPFDSYADSDYYTISEDQRQRDQDMGRLQSRRKSRPLQHFQPIGGAAPFITCYKCSELLQLPSDFLVFKGIRLHRVKCSACSTVLKYNLIKGRHLVPKNDADGNTESSSMFRRCTSASTYAADSEKTSLRSSSTNHYQDKGKTIMAETPNGPRVAWKQPTRTSPPLHQLMGYTSLSAALDGRGPNDQETRAESRN